VGGGMYGIQLSSHHPVIQPLSDVGRDSKSTLTNMLLTLFFPEDDVDVDDEKDEDDVDYLI